MTTVSADVIEDSISPSGIRLCTYQLRYHRWCHAEVMTTGLLLGTHHPSPGTLVGKSQGCRPTLRSLTQRPAVRLWALAPPRRRTPLPGFGLAHGRRLLRRIDYQESRPRRLAPALRHRPKVLSPDPSPFGGKVVCDGNFM